MRTEPESPSISNRARKRAERAAKVAAYMKRVGEFHVPPGLSLRNRQDAQRLRPRELTIRLRR